MKLFNDFYPLKTITTTNCDRDFITPEIKSLLRRKNKLIRHNQIEAANAVAQQIHTKIQKRNAASFTKPCKDTKELWKRVNRITGKSTQRPQVTPNINADQLNAHYAHISTDPNYVEPSKKQTCAVEEGPSITEYQIFKMLDNLAVTAHGTDRLPHWFVCIDAPSICSLVTHLFNLSLQTSIVPSQWKTSVITPVSKTKQPNLF